MVAFFCIESVTGQDKRFGSAIGTLCRQLYQRTRVLPINLRQADRETGSAIPKSNTDSQRCHFNAVL